MQLRTAERKRAKLRIGLSGPSWSGKTYSALCLAYGITGDWTKIALIDSENGSGELYSSLGKYNTLTLDAPYSPERYIEAIKICENAGMEVVIIDSTSHEWDGKWWCLEINDKLASAKFKGNSWAAWSETTPRHQKFIEAIVTAKCHIVTTARSKTETVQTDDKKFKKVGTKEIQREWFEYELTVNFNIDREHHLAIASKDRTGIFIDRDPFLIEAETGKELMKWNGLGVDWETVEAERQAREQAEKDNLYLSIIEEMSAVKFIDDLAKIWNTTVQPNKDFLGLGYLQDLTDRKDALKEQLSSGSAVCTPAPVVAPQPTTPATPPKSVPKPQSAPAPTQTPTQRPQSAPVQATPKPKTEEISAPAPATPTSTDDEAIKLEKLMKAFETSIDKARLLWELDDIKKKFETHLGNTEYAETGRALIAQKDAEIREAAKTPKKKTTAKKEETTEAPTETGNTPAESSADVPEPAETPESPQASDEEVKEIRESLIAQVKETFSESDLAGIIEIMAEYSDMGILAQKDIDMINTHIGLRRRKYFNKQ